MTVPDPRVKQGDGPHPNIAAVTALAESVHERLDALEIPRWDGRYPNHELTLLGRVAELLDTLEAAEASAA